MLFLEAGGSLEGGREELREFRAKLTLQPLDPRSQLHNLAIHPQQHLDDNLAASVIDRLSLNPLHTPRFDRPVLCPPDQLNGYRKPGISRD